MFKTLHPNKVFYRQTFMGVSNSVKQLKTMCWFSPIPNYGDSYGPVVSSYAPKKPLKLLDIGSMKTRAHLVSIFPKLNMLMDPDEQYSGGKTNLQIHKLLEKHFGGVCDGTIIVEKDLIEEDKELLEGPSEIVLWGCLQQKIKKL